MPVAGAFPRPPSQTQQPGVDSGQVAQRNTATPAAVQEDESDIAVWVDRAKKIVAQTQPDPYQQAQMLQQLISLYLKEHFDKDILGNKS